MGRLVGLAAAIALVGGCALDSSSPGPGTWLSEQGLYDDIANRTLAPDLIEFSPAFPLWTDGAHKRRWLLLPGGARIDTSDMDHWQFPVGTRLFKEFRMGEQLLETRMAERVDDTGDPTVDYAMGAFVWLPDQSDAVLTEEGADDLTEDGYDVPGTQQCRDCHGGEPGTVIGLSAVQQSSGVVPGIEQLADAGLLSDPPPEGERYAPPGDEVSRRALGALHGNCGHCHNPNGPMPSLTLRLDVADANRDVELVGAYRTAVGMPLESWTPPHGVTLRIAPADPGASGLLLRMLARDTDPDSHDQMPPLGTELVDEEATASVRAWIEAL